MAPNAAAVSGSSFQPGQGNRLEIRTPEGVVFAYTLAGPVSRLLAWLLDLFCIAVATQLITTPLALLSLLSMDFASAINLVLAFVLQIGYTIALEWYWRGQTVGKRLLRLRVIDVEGLRLRPQQIVLRNLLRAVDQFPLLYLVGGISVLASRRFQRLGDAAANTVVTRTMRLVEPDVEVFQSGKYNSLAGYPHLVARLVQRVPAREASVAVEALRRRDQLEPSARLELFHQLASHFRTAVPFPPEVWEGISDEQYVRDVVEVLFRKSR